MQRFAREVLSRLRWRSRFWMTRLFLVALNLVLRDLT